jgi:dephospho-CoA kinase
MQRPLQIGITGGIGSGKSLVCKIFQCLGVPVYDADSRAKELMRSDRILIEQIEKEFGTLAYLPEGGVNREYLAQTVFGEQEKLDRLNRLVHPRVAADYEQWVGEHRDKPYVIKEAALIFEAASSRGLDQTIVISAPEAIRMKRVLQRDRQRTKKDVQKIMASQMPEEEKVKRADFVIVNDESRLVIPQVLELHSRFSRK